MTTEFQPDLFDEPIDLDERAAEAAYRKSRKKPRIEAPPLEELVDASDGPIEIYPADLDRLRARARHEGRREGLGEVVKAVRSCIDGRFRLDPKEFVIGELPEGLDCGELLDALNKMFIEYGRRSFQDGVALRENNPEYFDRITLKGEPNDA